MTNFINVSLVMGKNKVVEELKINDTPQNDGIFDKYHRDLHAELVKLSDRSSEPPSIANFTISQYSRYERDTQYEDGAKFIVYEYKKISLHVSTNTCDDCRKRKRCPCDVTTRVARTQFLKTFCR